MKYAVNIATPSPAWDNFEEVRSQLREFVDNNAGEIVVNSAYHFAMNGAGLHRPGYAFTFWFHNETLAEQFLEKFDGNWVIEGLQKLKTGKRWLADGKCYYSPYLSKQVSGGYKFRRETQHGTQVRNSEGDEWQYFWDVSEDWNRITVKREVLCQN